MPAPFRNGARNIDQGLRCLPDRDFGDDLIRSLAVALMAPRVSRKDTLL